VRLNEQAYCPGRKKKRSREGGKERRLWCVGGGGGSEDSGMLVRKRGRMWCQGKEEKGNARRG
jgi:hypothetical protein